MDFFFFAYSLCIFILLVGRVFTCNGSLPYFYLYNHQVYVTARTHVGVSPPSRPLTAHTSGSPPVAPPPRQVASGNSSGLWVWLGRWADGGCPITHFTLELKRPRDLTWTTCMLTFSHLLTPFNFPRCFGFGIVFLYPFSLDFL